MTGHSIRATSQHREWSQKGYAADRRSLETVTQLFFEQCCESVWRVISDHPPLTKRRNGLPDDHVVQ
jgi:hypothetical protein